MMQNKPYLSLAERDRRYKLVRQAMKERGLDVLLVWGDSGKWDWRMANIQYLSGGFGGNGDDGLMVFPLEGEPTIIPWGSAEASSSFIKGWIEYGIWITDFRSREDSSYAKPAVELLKELKLTKATIGIPGLVKEDKILIPSAIFTELRAELPKADLRDASGLIEDIRLVKSPEEIALMEKAAQIGEAAIDTLAEVARPGVPENEVVGAMFHTMLSQGADLPIMFLWDAGRPSYIARLVWTRRRPLQKGDIILAEFSPRFHGYCNHLNQSAVVGDWPDKEWEKLYQAHIASYRAGYNLIRPGITVGELAKAFNEPFAAAGFTPPRGISFHGEGLGNEWLSPLLLTKEITSIVFREGNTVGFEPGVRSRDNSKGINLGDVVLVTRDGRRRLGKREPEIVICK